MVSEPGRAVGDVTDKSGRTGDGITDKRGPARRRRPLGLGKLRILLGRRWGSTEGVDQKGDKSYTLEGSLMGG